MADPGSIALALGTIIAGKYRLERPLARGGMGAVWVARHIALDEPVAIKLISISKDELHDAEVRLQREAKSAARLRSPHVVQLLDYGADQGVPYIVMELLEGEHLGERIKRKGRLSLMTSAAIVEQVAKALRRAHKAGIVHRDLKPANIFLARVDDEEIVKLLDFGIVKAVRGTLIGTPTQANMLIGSPNYMSPEQTAGVTDIDHRTDLWSLAAILFEAITGRMAFPGDSLITVLLSIRSGPLPVPSEVAPDLPKDIDAFFERAFERDRTKRFASARAMATEFLTIVKRLAPRVARVSAGSEASPGSEDLKATRRLSGSDVAEAATEMSISLEGTSLRVEDAQEDGDVPISVQSIPASHVSYAPATPPPMMAAIPATMGSPAMPPRREAPPAEAHPRREAPPRARPPAPPPPKVVARPVPPKPPPPPPEPRKPSPSGADLLKAMVARSEPPPRKDMGSDPELVGAVALWRSRKPMGSSPDAPKPEVPPAPKRKQMDSLSDMVKEDAAPWRSKGRVGELIDQGFAALRRGDREGARRCWRDALLLEPSNRALELNLRRLEAKKE